MNIPDVILPAWGSEYELETLTRGLNQICMKSGIIASQVNSVLELGCGYGRITSAALQVFTGAIIDAVDTVKILKISDQRLKFNKGKFTDVLSSGKVKPVKVLIMVEVGAIHGFNQDNIQLIKSAITEGGRLITGGDNSKIETRPWFLENFSQVAGARGLGGEIDWRSWGKK